ncbi:MAG: cbb3-type cytochrome c oxidase subunit I [Chloroflexota bacterium]|nr:cbb3-type cytochrome c oxidase subunit I [Chloroflexota bacterium]
MATVTARRRFAGAVVPPDTTEQPAQTEADHEHGLARFFYAATVALLFSAAQGVIQRLPGISDWLRDADYGGHMVTDLAHTHITVVGAGTISLTGLIYYVLPRVTKRPLFSHALTNLSFWATLIGVFGFYFAMIGVGLYEGAMVHAGWAYEAARDWMGAWHKAPMAITAAVMGVGYWTFVTNVYVTVGRGAGYRKVDPANAATDNEFLLAKFFAVSATGLLFGTVQGVYQVLPWSLDWLHKTGEAGHLIDPMAHAHMNLVGGVSVAIMGLLYYFLPKMLGRPIFSLKLGTFSFWCILVGVFGFYVTAVALGDIEGTMMLAGKTFDEAKATVGFWHPMLLAVSASIMGVGFWSFITNIFLTLRGKFGETAPADRKLVYFVGFAVTAILLGTIQGVLQILDPVENWLEQALPSSYFVTPLAHAQLNMTGFAIMSLAAMSLFLLPRILGKEVKDPAQGRRALTVLAIGVTCTYIAYFGLGLLESIAIHNGATPSGARQQVAGELGRYAILVGVQSIVAIGYIMLFRHVTNVIGREEIRAYFRRFRGRMHTAGQTYIRVHPRALPLTPADAQRKAIAIFAMEAIGGALGFMGIGWIYSGRPFIGTMLLGGWAGGFWTFTYVVLAVSGGIGLLPVLLIPYFTMPVLSAIGCYRSFMRDVRGHAQSVA